MMTAILLTLCILSSGFTGNLYKRLSDRSGGAAVSFAMPGFWFVPLTLFFVVLALASKESFCPESLLVAALAGISISVAASVQLLGDRLCVTSDVPLTIRTKTGLHYVPAGKSEE